MARLRATLEREDATVGAQRAALALLFWAHAASREEAGRRIAAFLVRQAGNDGLPRASRVSTRKARETEAWPKGAFEARRTAMLAASRQLEPHLPTDESYGSFRATPTMRSTDASALGGDPSARAGSARRQPARRPIACPRDRTS